MQDFCFFVSIQYKEFLHRARSGGILEWNSFTNSFHHCQHFIRYSAYILTILSFWWRWSRWFFCLRKHFTIYIAFQYIFELLDWFSCSGAKWMFKCLYKKYLCLLVQVHDKFLLYCLVHNFLCNLTASVSSKLFANLSKAKEESISLFESYSSVI